MTRRLFQQNGDMSTKNTFTARTFCFKTHSFDCSFNSRVRFVLFLNTSLSKHTRSISEYVPNHKIANTPHYGVVSERSVRPCVQPGAPPMYTSAAEHICNIARRTTKRRPEALLSRAPGLCSRAVLDSSRKQRQQKVVTRLQDAQDWAWQRRSGEENGERKGQSRRGGQLQGQKGGCMAKQATLAENRRSGFAASPLRPNVAARPLESTVGILHYGVECFCPRGDGRMPTGRSRAHHLWC